MNELFHVTCDKALEAHANYELQVSVGRRGQLTVTKAERKDPSFIDVPSLILPREPPGYSQEIPLVIHQTMKTRRLPYRMWIRGCSTWVDANPEYEYRFYDDEACLRFVTEHFPRVANAYVKCTSGVMRSDVFRYCLLYHEGGVYADVDSVCRSPLRASFPADVHGVTALAHEKRRSPTQWFLAHAKGSKIMLACIEEACNRITNASPLVGPWGGELAGYAGPPVVDLVWRRLECPSRAHEVTTRGHDGREALRWELWPHPEGRIKFGEETVQVLPRLTYSHG